MSPVVADEPASETQQQTGGMIDLKADEQPDGGRVQETPAPKNDATRPGGNKRGLPAQQPSSPVEVNANAEFALRYPYFIIMVCLVVALVGVVRWPACRLISFPRSICRWSWWPLFTTACLPQQIEVGHHQHFRTILYPGREHRSQRVAFAYGRKPHQDLLQAGTDPNAALSNIANLAMADLRRLPPGTLPPVVLGHGCFHAARLPGNTQGPGPERDQPERSCAIPGSQPDLECAGASVPQPYGGTYRQIQIYVDPLKLEAHNLSLNDVVQSVNNSNLILPAGDVRIGSKDFNIYANSQFPDAKAMNADAA